ncbi:MAG: hypothetical protein IPN68_18435 [Bacteroidetes bacterium]|nr:hypothetical protein [Bacteroidota bacterium]
MKSKLHVPILVILSLLTFTASAQTVYPVTSGEMIFSQSHSSFTGSFINQYPNAKLVANNVRFTVFFHAGEYIHFDFNNNVGMFSGLAIRNVGMITDEALPQTVSLVNGASVPYNDYKIIRRQYLLGVPLAFKIGAFNKHFFLYGGGEYEMAFLLKEKYWSNTFDRSGSKTKNSRWFSNQTPTFMPSVFAGVQLPGGVNLKFKYYLTDFLNRNYSSGRNSSEGSSFDLSDLSRYQESQVLSFSLCWQFKTAELWNDDEDGSLWQ